MARRTRRVGGLLLTGALFGCAAEGTGDTAVAVTRAALSVCDEMVPEDRYIDGIPAYTQCDATQNSAIYSNNGIDTSTTQMGPDWVRTQWSGGYQCTELGHRYLHFVWDVTWTPRGNAGEWCDTMPPATSGVVQSDTPVHGDLMVLAPGSCGASASTGHLVVVDTVGANGRLSVVEQNRARRGSYEMSCARCFLHVVANDGASVGGAGMGGAGVGGAAGAAGMGAGGAGAGAGSVPPPPTPEPEPAPVPIPDPTPPAVTPPVPMAGAGMAAPVPASPSAGAGVASAGAFAAPIGTVPARFQSESEPASCSVPDPGERSGAWPAALSLYALAFARLYRRRP